VLFTLQAFENGGMSYHFIAKIYLKKNINCFVILTCFVENYSHNRLWRSC